MSSLAQEHMLDNGAPAAVSRRVEQTERISGPCRVAVIWIDWYAYHVARFRGLVENPDLRGEVVGIELVGGIGVHAGLKFREDLPPDLPITTLMPGSSWKEAGQLRLAIALWRELSRLDPLVVLVPGYYTLPGLAAALWAKLSGSKSVLMTESTREDHVRVGWKEQIKGALIRSLFDWAITGGAMHRRYLEDLGFSPPRIARFYDVVDNRGLGLRTRAMRDQREASLLRREDPHPDRQHPPPAPTFLYVGRLAPEKNVVGLLGSYLEFRARGGTWGLTLVGDGPEAADLRRLAAASAYNQSIHFAGHKTSSELPDFYGAATCFVLPSTREPWGLVVNEAMAAGLPAIVSRRCGCAEDLILPGETGLTFDPADPADPGALARCLTEMSQQSPKQIRAMGHRAQQHVQTYSPENFGVEVARIARAS